MRGRTTAAVVMMLVAGRAEAAMHTASGSFEVTMTPASGTIDGIGRMTMAKVFAGPLAGTGHGEFLSAGNPASGSAGYVAIERFDGTLDGRAGGFVALHQATMNGGAPVMTVMIAPGSGSGELAGITGTMTIRNDGGQHRYVLEYDLPH